MKSLSACIESVVLDRGSETLIQDYLSFREQPVDSVFDKESLIAYVRHHGIYGTGNQRKLYVEMFEEQIARRGAEFGVRIRDSIFNAILAYAQNAISDACSNEIRIKTEHIENWHLLTSRLGEDLFVCSWCAIKHLEEGREFDFLWSPYLRMADDKMTEFYKREMVDLHNHLKGSSLHFDLSWLYLMNHINCQTERFRKISIRLKEKHVLAYAEPEVELYLSIIKAAAIRYYLWQKITGSSRLEYSQLIDVLEEQTMVGGIDLAGELQSVISFANQDGKSFVRKEISSTSDTVDYAIPKNLDNGVYAVLTGERKLLYEVYRRIYQDTDSESVKLAELLYIYVTIKAQFRQELIQTNDVFGFENFANYQSRKETFLPENSAYERLLLQLAVAEFVLGDKDSERYMETRITPKQTKDTGTKQIRKLDKMIQSAQFLSKSVSKEQYDYIYHFIKSEDKVKGDKLMLQCRHHDLRETVRLQAKAILQLKRDNALFDNRVGKRIVGIDAASSELAARPEVFAQAYRYLHGELQKVGCEDFGFTYHVGEDFWDVADGLRALDELILFCDLHKHDRLGHALVLGVDLPEYYEKRGYELAIPLQVWVDNLCWMYHYVKNIPTYASCKIKVEFETYLKQLYGTDKIVATIEEYYQSMQLRGDNPGTCFEDLNTLTTVDGWSDYVLVTGVQRDAHSIEMYRDYHYRDTIKKNGQKTIKVTVDEGYVDCVKICQLIMNGKIHRLKLGIECNPTSNLMIGEMESYANHPLLRQKDKVCRFFKKRLTVNTDDKGVFSTSLEREYALLYAAHIHEGKSENSVYKWLDRLREAGTEQSFARHRSGK